MKPNNLNTIKNTGFKTPQGYFESFDDMFLSQLNIKMQTGNKNHSGFKTPQDYFETFDQRLQQKLKNTPQPKVIAFPLWKKAAFVSGIAACLVLMFGIFNKSNTIGFETLDTASIENYIYEENINSYDIAMLLDDDDLVIENFIMTPISDESLETYLLDNTTIENLMFEDYE